ncbi:MAG: hypothetical protein K9G58_13640 [Bacteroidales bacterium]|nr:hypothetical protein [Bacteroidales bacterium]MCF8399212.1 hypothetical protein [Bacteroidales bacterium]
MTEVLEILKYVLPSLIVLAAVYLMLREFVRREERKMLFQMKDTGRKTVLPMRLQAYERMVLLLERISPENLVMRISKSGMKASQLKAGLIKSIREEYEHNLSQQLYISNEAWARVRNAKEGMVNMINAVGARMDEKSSSAEFTTVLFDKYLNQKKTSIANAMDFIKEEMRKEFT